MKRYFYTLPILLASAVSAHSEICVENDTGLADTQFSVGFVTSLPLTVNSFISAAPHLIKSQEIPGYMKHLDNGDQFCIETVQSLYLVVYIRPLLSDPADYSNSQTYYVSNAAFSNIGLKSDVGISVQLNSDRTPKVSATPSGSSVEMKRQNVTQ